MLARAMQREVRVNVRQRQGSNVPVIAANSVTRASTSNGLDRRRGRVSVITFRLTRVALAAMALTAGGYKFTGPPANGQPVRRDRLGQWFGDATRVIEISSPGVQRQQ
jgi:hypothetical protein